MGNYGYNPDEHYETKLTLIDKDGFQKEGNTEDIISDYNELREEIENRGIPSGGESGQMLTKASNDDYDVEWSDIPSFTENVETMVANAANAWLQTNITNPSNPPLDGSLSLSNAAAPADKVGELKSALSDITENESKTETIETTLTFTNGYLSPTGQIYTGGSYDTLGYTVDGISVQNGDIIRAYAVNNGTDVSTIRAIILYKGSTVVSGGGDNVSLPFTIPENVDTVRFSANNNQKTAGIKIAITRTINEIKVKLPDNVVVEEGIKQVTADNLQIVENLYTSNILNVETSTAGKLISADGTISDNNAFNLSDYIPVDSGTEYIFSWFNGQRRIYGEIRRYACFDLNKQVVANTGSDSTVSRPFTIPAGVSYIRISYSSSSSYTELMFRTGNNMYYPYEPYMLKKLDLDYIPYLDDLKKQMDGLNSGRFDRIGNVRTTLFDSETLPSEWENSGFALSASGAAPSATGDLLQYNQYNDLDSSCFSVTINATTAFNLYLVRYQKQYAATGGMIVGFDMVNKKVKLYKPTVVGTMPSESVAEFDIPFDFVAGQYTMTVGNCAELERYTIFGAGKIAEFYTDGRYLENWTRPHDKYGILHNSGTYSVKQISFSSPLPSEPDVLIVGDSICEADTIRMLKGGGFKNRWVGLLSNVTLCALWGQGGNNSTHINNDLTTLTTLFKPKKVIYAIGVNDSAYATWLANCQTFTAAFEAIGAEVIYATPVLRTSYETGSLVQQRAWIKASGHRYIDFCSAMSVNGACQEINTALFLSDQLHPNVEGHKQMYDTVMASLPDLIMY